MKKETARAVQVRDASAAHGAIEAAAMELIRAIGEDPTRDGLRETPARVARSYAEMTAGYEMDPFEILGTVFEAPAGAPAGVGTDRASGAGLGIPSCRYRAGL